MVSQLRQRALAPHLTLATLAALALIPTQAAQAQVTVTGSQTGAFIYSFSVFNGTPIPLAVLSLDIPVNTMLTNLTAPTGFFIAYDPNPALDGSAPGRVDFLEDADPMTTATFDAFTTIAGFSFESTSTFAPSTYVALDLNGLSYTPNTVGVVFPGTTTLNAAPEPGTLSLFVLAGLPALALLQRRNRRRAAILSPKGTI
ncbi:PEP-CTERM sorting domain-containing protein [Armatimonas sp.]|uniref:PEP-CTERM sorting domain-containing protein n=1 Tax=Armatimonas sp. TaxID=1872638 RepID=UPI0037520D32